MESIDILEKRIASLETQILPKNGITKEDKSTTISALLLQTQTMISTALSCRESITAILEHMNTINEYLDPRNGEDEIEIEGKRHYLLELYPELIDTVQLISSVESLTPYTDSANFVKVTELSSKLEQLAYASFNTLEEERKTTENIIKCLKNYNNITSSIKILFAQLDTAISDLELALQPKFTTEE